MSICGILHGFLVQASRRCQTPRITGPANRMGFCGIRRQENLRQGFIHIYTPDPDDKSKHTIVSNERLYGILRRLRVQASHPCQVPRITGPANRTRVCGIRRRENLRQGFIHIYTPNPDAKSKHTSKPNERLLYSSLISRPSIPPMSGPENHITSKSNGSLWYSSPRKYAPGIYSHLPPIRLQFQAYQ